jgi:hypothetical protein
VFEVDGGATGHAGEGANIIDSSYKLKRGTEGISQYMKLANNALKTGDVDFYKLSVSAAKETAERLASIQAKNLAANKTQIAAISNAIKTLSADNSTLKFMWSMPTREKFVSGLAASGVDEGIANSIYDEYVRYLNPSQDPKSAVAAQNLETVLQQNPDLANDQDLLQIYTALKEQRAGRYCSK